MAEDRDLGVLGDVANARDLELLAHLLEERNGLGAPHDLALERGLLREDHAHLLLDGLEILGRERALEQEVVLELLGVIAATDVDLHRRVQSRFTASAITCSAEWRMMSLPASGILAGDDLERDVAIQGETRRSTSSPSIRPASAARARPLPIRSATERTVEPAGTASVFPSGRRTRTSLMSAGGS